MDPSRIPLPSHRHASPCGPWPWMDLESDEESETDTVPPVPHAIPPTNLKRRSSVKCTHKDVECRCWTQYPQSLFSNWTPRQVKRSRMKEASAKSDACVIHRVDVGNDAKFSNPSRHSVLQAGEDKFWKMMMKERPEKTRVRALFVEDLSLPVLQMLGTKYNIEPFFFTSSVNWIPSRYQEEVQPMQGDHITITLTFLRSVKVRTISAAEAKPGKINDVIDTQLPFPLPKDASREYEEWEFDKFLHLDLLAIHMIRTTESSTIISFHPQPDRRSMIPCRDSNKKRPTPAKRLHSRVCLAGRSVYWQKIFKQSNDPTFVLLTVLWYALYAWDEALEILWKYICQLESGVIGADDVFLARELHKIRAHLLHYASLLEDFRKSVSFLLETSNPAMNANSHSDTDRKLSEDLLKREANNLFMEIDRLEMSRKMYDSRLTNVMNLGYSTHMQNLTEAAVRDSAAMKSISYLTMIYLPASFIASVFGMNVKEINPDTETLARYLEVALPLTGVTIWAFLSFRYRRKDIPQPTMGEKLLDWMINMLGNLKKLGWGDRWGKNDREAV